MVTNGDSDSSIADTKWGYPSEGIFQIKLPSLDKKKIIYYPLDANQFRPILNQTEKDKFDKHFIISGDSNIFGYHLSDDQTISNKLRNETPLINYEIVNISFPGWSSSNILAQFEFKDIKAIIPHQKGVHIHAFSLFHLRRVCGFNSSFTWNKGSSPNYILRNNNLYYGGLYRDSIKFHLFLVRSALESLFPRIQSATSEYKYDSACIYKAARIILELKKKYLSLYSKGKFVAVLMPLVESGDDHYTNELVTLLRKFQISTLIDKKRVPIDGLFSDNHLNNEGTTYFVKFLLENLELESAKENEKLKLSL
ncbi:hypothetical protein [Halobacteriovorax sp. HLS]|uniref:hypothetical protein n=1 Tax=Halobacteriovorax sp. HLS TaxID=2234000 RepID=UPI000FDB60C6|nr:hypothetical protein [Halobacteriovorax sp. HLS]